jgi:hypothetical protein
MVSHGSGVGVGTLKRAKLGPTARTRTARGRSSITNPAITTSPGRSFARVEMLTSLPVATTAPSRSNDEVTFVADVRVQAARVNLEIGESEPTERMKGEPCGHLHQVPVKRPRGRVGRTRDSLCDAPSNLTGDVQHPRTQLELVAPQGADSRNRNPINPEGLGGARGRGNEERNKPAEQKGGEVSRFGRSKRIHGRFGKQTEPLPEPYMNSFTPVDRRILARDGRPSPGDRL